MFVNDDKYKEGPFVAEAGYDITYRAKFYDRVLVFFSLHIVVI